MENYIKLKNRLAELKAEESSIEKQLYDLKRSIPEPKPVYGNRIVECFDYQDFMSKQTYRAIRVTDHLLNRTELDEYKKLFGSVSGYDDVRRSVAYHRNEYNILTHGGGGYMLLRDCIPCSDDEWNLIASGNIPDKFKSKNF